MARPMIILGSLLIIVVAASSPVTASSPKQAETAVMCLREGSYCDNGRDCCSRECWGAVGEQAICL